jgi:hypothetical protein
MPRSMVHPYWGTLVVCAEVDGGDHNCGVTYVITQWEMCDNCGSMLETCKTCKTFTQCCPCGHHHAPECPWPL